MAQGLSEGVLSASLVRYRHVLTWASAVSFVSTLMAFWVWTPSREGIGRLPAMLVLSPFLLPYGFIPVQLYSNRLRSGLSLALAIACALSVPGICLIGFVYRWDKNWWILSNLILALLMQPVLIVGAIKMYSSMPCQPRAPLRILGSVAFGLFLFGSFWFCYSPVPRYLTANERFATKYLEALALSAVLQASEHGGYYPEAFDSVGSHPDPKCRVKGPYVLNPGNPAHGYLFDYRGLPPSTDVHGCTWFSGFTMTARPVVFGRTGIRSFFGDSTVAVHFTSENRPATASDPVDQTSLKEHRP